MTLVTMVTMGPPGMHMLRVMGSVVPMRRMGGASLERAEERQHQRERNDEQQYEQANRPQQERELPSMGAAGAECGRSLSA